MNEGIPEGKWARAGIVGSTAVKLGLGQLKHTAKRPFLSKQRHVEAKEELEDQNARLLFNALTQLRGTALKAAQMLSMEVELLPERYRKELEKSYHQVPPLNRVLVRKVLQEQFGQPPETLFAEFDAHAFAAASLGQVHAAVLPDGTQVAVKIQYPGIHVAMDNDMKLLRQLTRGLPNSPVVKQSLDEIHARLLEEVDYTLEAENTRWFREHLQLESVSVPRVFSDYSTERVLTTERSGGKHLQAWLAENPSQAVRNLAAQNLYDLFAYSFHQLHRLHADPNPGNYLFHADGSLTLLDFGCVKQMSGHFVRVLPGLLKAYHDDDAEAIFSHYRQLGMHHADPDSKLYEEVLRPFGEWVAMPFREVSFDFGKHGDYTSSAHKLIQQLARFGGLDAVADEFIFFDRTIHGLCKIFERMGAEVRIRQHWFGEEREEIV
ncbi:ABC1 kinase family protein [Thiothrix nivea]|uniref:ABC-1 domain-containing protein n=1 Tax=Thiothrix nivea (strain ATCC 35100 / DSM 5205 / JP2) TaxID=870187 RepID=A0A656HGZ8_THINJ|nr:AarF/ABC1/UbiB kinase family protein [Thiothrix nivea]EIJ34766.1 ABC-1 domain-containing protein [Thiothrix nivea DSM 5205]